MKVSTDLINAAGRDRVVIEGFKSYREQIATEPFSSKVNCVVMVVGANGSGKTNFFHAIRFVLSDLFQNLRSDDRHALLHEGAGHQVLSAFVEIVFDNSDNRIPVDKEEVRLRRTIGLKKDEYFLDGKHITKTEVMNLLESAGFSRSNPYYVVQQGKIASLTLMKDSERLDLLKEIGGTRVYEERRRESNKRKQIIQVVQYLDERLKELDEEKEELKKYQQLDKQRKSLEYAIYSKEVQDAQQKLTELVSYSASKASDLVLKEMMLALSARQLWPFYALGCHVAAIEISGFVEDEATTIRVFCDSCVVQYALVQIEDARAKVSETSAKKYNDVVDAHEKSKDLENTLKDVTKELQNFNKEKEVIEKRRRVALQKHTGLELDVKDLQEKISGNIRAKEDAAKQLEILEKEIEDSTAELGKIIPLHEDQVQKEKDIAKQYVVEQKLLDEIDRLNEELCDCDENINRRKSDITALETLIAQSRDGLNHSKVERDKLHDHRKSLWNTENELTAEIDKLRAEVEKAEKSLDHAIPGDVRRGLNSVRKICREYNISGVHGPIIELLNCDEKFFTAVEVTAGNRVKSPRITYPQSSDVIPLLKKLNFKHDYTPAFSQVFARTVICKNLDVASRVARTDGLDCITLDGDQVSKKGSMTGGFYDHRRSRLKFMNIIKQHADTIRSKEDELEKSLHIDRRINELVAEQQKIDAKRAHDKSEMDQFKQDIANANKQKQLISKALAKKEKSVVDVQNQIEQLKASITMKKAEMGTELIDHLTPAEKKLLSDLNPEIKDLKEKLVACKTDRIETEARKAELDTNLTTNLRRRKQELEAVISSVDDDSLVADAELKQQELSDSKILVDDATGQLRSETSLEDEYDRKLQEEAKELEQLLSKKNIYAAKEEEYAKKIRELGPLSSDAFEAYKRRNIKELNKMLHRCNEKLQQFSHVNKKALDQYINFTEQREELQKRQAELDAGDEKIRELISVLDQRKDESIERTFKGVARHFREVFSELVQGGHGHLVMMKKKDGGDHDDDEDEDGPREVNPEGRVEKYIGVKVSFTGQGETQSMKQLSGGQKTVVALTLIFAIQRCDPAPFYLFDEIDAALDPQYRTAVGNMIRRLADIANTQFITTTFRPELVKVADKIYGVTHKNRVSRVNVVSKDDALEFIEHDQTHNAE
ncbi:hypothetical protein Fmac_030843 [Flemingia macrophylla]|uniref:Structural maintenance of chromosomes protein n=1 Tax=Flemingia macrophylla TaxID=520843 RepID=A0ABD1L0B9_9FABA